MAVLTENSENCDEVIELDMPEMEKGRISEQERIVHRRMRKFPPNYSTNMAAKCARRLQMQNFQKLRKN